MLDLHDDELRVIRQGLERAKVEWQDAMSIFAVCPSGSDGGSTRVKGYWGGGKLRSRNPHILNNAYPSYESRSYCRHTKASTPLSALD